MCVRAIMYVRMCGSAYMSVASAFMCVCVCVSFVLWVVVISCVGVRACVLRRDELLPSIVFSFSKARCDEIAFGLAGRLASLLVSEQEAEEVRRFVDACVARVREQERSLPQLQRTRELLLSGVGVHHSGMLPLVREMVEMLFQRGLVKVIRTLRATILAPLPALPPACSHAPPRPPATD